MKIQKISLPIEGMTCANCALRIEKVLRKTDGVINANVDLASEIATFEVDENIIKIDAIKNRIEKLGYSIPEKKADIDEKDYSEKQLKFLKKQKTKFLLSLILTIPVVVLGMNLLYTPSSYMENIFINSIVILFTSIVLFYSGSQFLYGFYKSIINLYPDMNTLVSIGTLSAYIYSLVEFFNYISMPSHHALHLYFDTTATIITFILLGKYLERRTKNSSSDAVKSLLKMQTKNVSLIRDGKELITSAEFIKYGDIIILHPGESIPVDGIVLEGNASIDESFVTGESLPIDKKSGNMLTSGTECKSGALKYKAEKVGRDTYLSSIIELIKRTQSTKPAIQKYVDKVAAVFVPAIIIIAIITFIYWYFWGSDNDISTALLRFVSVLIISCPCSLGLATPTAIVSAIGLAAKNNIYYRDVDSIERVKEISTLVLDKTGTVTTGELEVTNITTFNSYKENEILQIASSGEFYSEHPVGKAIVRSNKKSGNDNLQINNFQSLSGYGIKFAFEGMNYTIGNKEMFDLFSEIEKSKLDTNEIEGSLMVFVACNEIIIGIIFLSDTLKDDAVSSIAKIKNLGIETMIVSGDNYKSTQKTASILKVDKFISDVKPEQKLEILGKLQSEGKIVAMAGDGINDAPALTKADISMAFSSGTDAAVNSSDITFTKNDLNSVYNSIIISNKTMKIIKQNLFWAFFYNLICVPVAAGLFMQYGVSINPSLAALAMAFSSVSVVSNSLRIKRMDLYDTK